MGSALMHSVIELCESKTVSPHVWLIATPPLQILYDFMIGLLRLSIGLRMKGYRQLGLDSKQLKEFLCKLRGELWPMISHNRFREIVTSPDIVNEELCQLLRGTLLCFRSKYDFLKKLINNG